MTDGPRFRVIAICSGNVCRSPFLELLLGRALADRGDLEVASAGTIARPRMRMTDEMVQVATRYGIPRRMPAPIAPPASMRRPSPPRIWCSD
jgi:protein-tyrosine phosphatase